MVVWMEILLPKYIGDGVLQEEKYSDFWRLINIQGLRPFLYMCEGYYPCFVAAAYTTIFIRDNRNDEGNVGFFLGFKIGGREYQFHLHTLAIAWDLKNEGATFKGGRNLQGTWNKFDMMDAVRELRLEPAVSGKSTVSRMTTVFLLYVLSYVLLPRKSNHGTTTEEDLLILWAMIKEKQIHWPYLMAHRMLRYSHGKANSFLGHVHLWTNIFEIAPLDLTREEVVTPGETNVITSKNINQM
ncbi:hypothetical protein PIB30_077240 [Stylosanthes scabra]|uniref:Uncharacterized protein n=1 Tax=Stylosanthes scabra TaxID=79078 RepID=A0ABU6QR48_9FABA|nr:hypothetical protein [Stylosanthes scabra]